MSSETPRDRLPGPGRPLPTATYRIQLTPEQGFAAAAEQADYLAALGVSHAYLSPLLQAAPGSTHGYDVVDHDRVNEDLGGAPGLAGLHRRLRDAGVGMVADVVPNHMAVPVPESLNVVLWSVLRDGPESPYAGWFDVDWDLQHGALLMPVLGRRIGEVVDAGELVLDRSGGEPVLRYHDHVFPVRAGTEDLPLADLVGRQWYRLAYWRVADEELNYRRFFDIDTLAGLRVEREEVFAQSHALLVALVHEGVLEGLRVDHPDGLADPRGYLRRLAAATGRSWVVVEKVLGVDEELPGDWPCAGTTGYDALSRVGGVFLDPAGAAPLTRLYTELTGDPPTFAPVAEEAKRLVVEQVLHAEVHRLVELLVEISAEELHLRDHPRRALREALVELLVACDVYRAYVVPGEDPPPATRAVLTRTAQAAARRLPAERHAALAVVVDLALGRRGRSPAKDDFCVRFQQTCGAVMAKGVEDTAGYRWWRLAALNEVGGDPDRFGTSPAELHAFCARLQRDWPATMTTLTTHDTKRSEDVRARLGVLSQLPAEWARAMAGWQAAASRHRSPEGWPDPATEYLVWQTLVGAWPVSVDRLTAYLRKAAREAKRHTSWTDPVPAYETALDRFASGVRTDPDLAEAVDGFVATLAPHARAVTLGQKLVQLTMPGVPDVYQGSELDLLTLVDPDNRGPVDYAVRRRLLADLDAGRPAADLAAAKLLVTSRALRLRRDHPDWFGPTGTYRPLPTSTPHSLAFARSEAALTVVSRLTVARQHLGGWGAEAVELPPGRWRDLLTGRPHPGGSLLLARLLDRLPVALLVADDASGG